MHVGWRYYLKQRFKKTSSYHSLGLEFKSETVQLCALQRRGGELVWVKQHLFPLNGWVEQLRQYVSNESLQNTPTYVILSPGHYQLVQVEKPSVSDEELKQALVWSVKDLVSYDEDLSIDFFDLAAQSAGANKVNVAVVPKSQIEQIVSGISQAGLDLEEISIIELAAANVIGDTEDAVLSLVQEAGQEVCLNIIKHGKVYFSRRLRGYENLSTFNEQELQMGVGDNLSVEIQRSMDYFESQLRQAPVKKIVLGLETPIQDAFADILQQLTFMTVEPITLALDKDPNLEFSSSYIGCLGGALGSVNGGVDEN